MSGLKSDMDAFMWGLVLCLVLTPLVDGLKCYSCTATGPETDCEVEVKEMTILACRPYQTHCTIRRVEKDKYPGRTTSFARACETDPPVKNAVIIGGGEVAYFVACQSDLCNEGDGTREKDDKKPEIGKPALPSWEELMGITSGSSHVNTSFVTTIVAILTLILQHLAIL